MKRYTLIVDGYNLYFRTLWACFKNDGKKVLTTEKEVDAFEKKLYIDFDNIIKSMGPVINDVVFIQDAKSWRKELLLEREYKANRKSQESAIDFNGFNTAIANFTNILSRLNVKMSRIERCEGDDLIYAWTNYLSSKGVSSMIYSTDKDLTQLVSHNLDSDIIQYAPIANKLFVSKETLDEMQKEQPAKKQQVDLFEELMTISIGDDLVSKFFNAQVKEVVEPDKVRFLKVISGDSSDNIYPVYYKAPSEENSRAKGIGEKTCQKILDEFERRIGYPFNYKMLEIDESINVLCDVIYDIAKLNKDKSFTKSMLAENIKTNKKLVVLNNSSIPSDLVDEMNKHILVESKKPYCSLNKLSRDNLFAESRFKSYKSHIQMSSKVLKGVEDDDDMSFIKG